MQKLAYLIAGLVLGAAATYGLWVGKPDLADDSSITAFDPSMYLPDGTWADLDGDCQNTRTEVLLALGLDVKLDEKGCTVVGGSWRDAFTGEPLQDPEKVAIVRIVPLTAAHNSGAWAWNPARKLAFANSFERATAMSMRPRAPLTSNLVTVSRATEKEKGDNSIINWVPHDKPGITCTYTENWTIVKAKWGLSTSKAERDKISQILSVCP